MGAGHSGGAVPLADAERRAVRTLLESSQYGLLILDDQLRIVWVSTAGAAALRYRIEDLVGHRGAEFLDPEQSPGVLETIGEVLRPDREVEPGWQVGIRIRLRCGDGTSRDFEFGGWAVEGSRPRELLVVFRDVEETARLEDVLTAITGHDLEGALHHFLTLASAQLQTEVGIALHPSLGGSTYTTPGARPGLLDELSVADANPAVRPVTSASGTVVGWLVVDRHELTPWGVETMSRLSSLLGLVLAHQATITDLVDAAATDPLTGLANRRVLEFSLLAAETNPERGWALLYCDLDRFKAINDQWGHDVGDAVLCAVGERLVHAVRSADVVARLGGDEFVVFAQADRALAEQLEARVRSSLSQPIEAEHGPFELGMSVGVATATTAAGVRDLLAAADDAMRRDKAARRRDADR